MKHDYIKWRTNVLFNSGKKRAFLCSESLTTYKKEYFSVNVPNTKMELVCFCLNEKEILINLPV